MKIVEQLADIIRRGEFIEGQQLPTEHELARSLRVSRTSLREALVVLEMLGLIETRHGQGRFVRADQEAPFLHLNSVHIGEDESPFVLLEARKAFEPGVAALAATARTEEDVSRMQRILESGETHRRDVNQRTKADRLLHRAVAAATHNPLVQCIGEFLTDFMVEALWLALDRAAERIPGRLEEGWAEHRAICEAIEAEDADGACRAVLDHLTRVEQAMVEG